ncbi:MAG: glycosyltransferase family 4 protein [Longimicrobiales bacterium]
MTAPPSTLHMIVPGPLDQRTGGYLYDARIVSELADLGASVHVHSIPGRFPEADDEARAGLHEALARLDDGSTVVIDGLAAGGVPDVVADHTDRLAIVALVHHPLADETGQTPEQIERSFASERETLRHVRGVIVTSPFTARRLADFDVPEDRIRVVEPGTDPAPLADGPPADAPARLVCVASLSPRKGHDMLVDALDRLRALDWSCVCAGSITRDVDFSEGVRSAVEARGLGDRIDFCGELETEELEEVYRTASLFVLPSHYEGYGMAYAEALARGIPVVGTTGGAIPDTVPGYAGVLVPPGDVDALTNALEGLLVAPDRRDTLAEGARMHAEALPRWSEQAGRFRDAVSELSGLDGRV